MAQGREVTAAIKKASTWGTPLAAGAGDGVLILSEGLGAGAAEDLIAEEAGVSFVESSDRGNVDIDGTVTAFYRYEGAVNRLMALAMGTATVAQIGTTTAYRHQFDLANTLDGVLGTWVVGKNVSVWEWPSVKVFGFTLSGQAGQPIQIEFRMRADSLNRNTSSGTNNNTTLSNVTYRSKALRALFQHLTFRMNNQGAAALASPADEVKVTRFRLAYARPMDVTHIQGSRFIIEPTENGLPEVRLEIQLPEYTADTFLSDLDARTAKKADLTFNSGVSAGDGNNYSLLLQFPQLYIVGGEAAVDGAGKIVAPLTLRAEMAQSAPAGMTGITKPFHVETVNKAATGELA